ncbi:MAG: hypothetical protein GY796_21490 [Chloroflexi bacterium]|nr:hypothetical protein [Chloroflexota bacterium]
MELSEITIPMLCGIGISPFVLGWIILSFLMGTRVGWEAGIRLFLLGVGVPLAIGAIFLWLPDWAAVILMLVGALWPWVTTLRYLAIKKVSGKLLMALPLKEEERLISITSGAVLVIAGLVQPFNNFLTPAKAYVFNMCLISWGVLRAIPRILHTQIRDVGILYRNSNLYKWENIESYVWKLGEDKLSLKLKRAVFNRNVDLKLLSQFRHKAVPHLSKNISSIEKD